MQLSHDCIITTSVSHTPNIHTHAQTGTLCSSSKKGVRDMTHLKKLEIPIFSASILTENTENPAGTETTAKLTFPPFC